MAKKLIVGGEAGMVHWTAVHWFKERNTRVGPTRYQEAISDIGEAVRPLKQADKDKPAETDDDRKSGQGLVNLLLGGWDADMGVSSIACTVPTEAEIKRAVQQREAQLKLWESVSSETEPLAAIYHKLAAYTREQWFPGGKPCEIVAIGNLAYRRGSVLPAVAYARSVRNIAGDYMIPIRLVEYVSPLAKYDAHVKENLGNALGRKPYTPQEEAKMASEYMALGMKKESELLKRGMKRGAAQKAWAFAELDAKLPELKLMDRIFMAPPTPEADGKAAYAKGGFVPYKSMQPDELRKLLAGRDPLVRGKLEDSPYIKGGCNGRNVENYVKSLYGGVSRPVLGKAQWEELTKSGSRLVRLIATLAAKGDPAFIESFDATWGLTLDNAIESADIDFDDITESVLPGSVPTEADDDDSGEVAHDTDEAEVDETAKPKRKKATK